MKSDTKKKLQRLQVEYFKKLPAKLLEIEKQWRVLNLHFDKQGFKDFHRIVHSLCGSSGIYGYSSLSHAIRDMEIYLEQLLDYQELNPTQQSEISHLVERIKDILLKEQEYALSKSSKIRNRVVLGKLILYLIEREGKFARELQMNLKKVGYQLILVKTLSALQTLTKDQLPAAIIVDEFHLNDKKIKILAKYKQYNQINLLCIARHENINTRIKALHVGISIFLHKPVDIFYLSNLLVKLCSLSAKEDYRILILDDSESLAKYYALVLEEAGMSVRTTTKPLDLMQELQDFNPNLLLMDLYLPECSGFDLAKVIRQEERYASLPIIFISTEDDRYKQLAILNGCGGDDFLTKPVLPQNLVAAVKSRAQRAALLVSYIVQDSLTKLLNHTYILTQLEFEILRAQRQNQTTSVAIIDLDNFKQVNDKHGHLTGDMVLKKLAVFLTGSVRRSDFIGRYGGEEFAIIFPNTSLEKTVEICNKIREKFAVHPFEANDNMFYVTLSIGVADYPSYKTVDSLVSAADKALYRAKSKGRNRVEI